MARNDSGEDPEGRRVTNYQAALLERLAGLDPHEVERGLNMSEAMDPDPLSERVRKYVLETSGGLAEVHRRTGLPKMTLSGWLRGEKHITTGNFDAICKAYGIEPVRLLDADPSDHVPAASQLSELSDSDRIRLEAEAAKARAQAKQAESRTRVIVAEGLKIAAANVTHAVDDSQEALSSAITKGLTDVKGSFITHGRKGTK